MQTRSNGKGSTHLALALLAIVALCLCPVLANGATAGASKWSSNAPTLDGVVSQGEWPDSPQLNMTKTRIYFMNDQKFLYLLVDMPDSTGNVVDDPVTHRWGDGMAVCVDIDRDGKETPMVDFEYSWLMVEQTARTWPISDSGWTGGYTNTTSKIVWGFGPTPASSTPHRFFEVKLNLTEMRASPGDKIRLAFWTKSVTPSFIDRYPRGFDNADSFGSFYELELGRETLFGLEPILFYSLAGLAAVCAVGIVILLIRRGKARPSPPPPPPPA